MKNKILNEEVSRIKDIMFPGMLTEVNILTQFIKNAIKTSIKTSVKNIIDDLVKKGLWSVVDDMAKKGLENVDKLQFKKMTDDVIKEVFPNKQIVAGDRAMVEAEIRKIAEEESKNLARTKAFGNARVIDDAGKKVAQGADDAGKKVAQGADDASKKGVKNTGDLQKKARNRARKQSKKVTDPVPVGTPPTRSWRNKLGEFANKTWGKRILWGAATLSAGYLLWLTFWGDDDDIPPCMKFLVENDAEFEKFLVDGYVQTGNYRIYPENKVILVTAEGGEREGEWEFDEGTMTLNLDFDGITKSLPCPTDNTPELSPEDGGTTGSEDSSGSGVSGGGSGSGSYRECTDFPIIQGCKGQKVIDIQKCLGGLTVDGKYGPKTQSKVESSGYGSDGVSQEEYNKIMQKCGVDTAPENKGEEIQPVLNF